MSRRAAEDESYSGLVLQRMVRDAESARDAICKALGWCAVETFPGDKRLLRRLSIVLRNRGCRLADLTVAGQEYWGNSCDFACSVSERFVT